MVPLSSKDFFNIKATAEGRLTLKCIRGMIKDLVKCTIQISTHNTAQSFGWLAKWLSVCLRTKCFWVKIPLLSLNPNLCNFTVPVVFALITQKR